MKVKVSKTNCIGCGMCVQMLPDIFKMGINGKAMIIDENILESEISEVSECCDICPTQAIKIEA